MKAFRQTRAVTPGRSPHGERGLKCWQPHEPLDIVAGRSPHGERGLKSEDMFGIGGQGGVALLMESVD